VFEGHLENRNQPIGSDVLISNQTGPCSARMSQPPNKETESDSNDTNITSTKTTKSQHEYLRLAFVGAFLASVTYAVSQPWYHPQQAVEPARVLVEPKPDPLLQRQPQNHGDDPKVVFQDWFRQQGGWISPQLSLVSDEVHHHGNGLRVSSGGHLHQNDRILEIPKHLIFTSRKLLDRSNDSRFTATATASAKAKEAIEQYIENPLDQQDALIALDLMLECCRGPTSLWFPYLQVLPTHVPRLAMFSNEELSLLQDTDLASYALIQRQELKLAWKGGIQSAVSSWRLQQQQQASSSSGSDYGYDDSCLTESSFHHYVAISSSRAMILDNIKYLTPMAEMINHAERPLTARNDDVTSETSASTTIPTMENAFQLYHKLEHDTTKLVVYADRDFHAGDMIVEEYGQLDNSLYISAFGFVPPNNPHHCVVLPMPQASQDDAGNTVCVGRDGSTSGEDSLTQQQLLRAKVGDTSCNTINDGSCDANHLPRDEVEISLEVKKYVQHAARAKLASYPTSLPDDEGILRDLEMSNDPHMDDNDLWRGMNRDRARFALQFRMEDKKLLLQILQP
jgi:hypothetical protein